jgi:methylated-DNA-[protein]-cysteine S-methyltransferase
VTTQYATLSTPDGPFTVILNPHGILASGWTADVPSLVALIHPTLRPALRDIDAADATQQPDPTQQPGSVDVAGPPITDAIAAVSDAVGATVGATVSDAVAAVRAYYDGDLEAPGRLAVQQVSGEFRMHAWDVLRQVTPGERITYSEYAARSGRPAAVRAAAGACALNAAALFVPCHRVLRTDGTLGGFRYGLEVKERLLAREAAASRI